MLSNGIHIGRRGGVRLTGGGGESVSPPYDDVPSIVAAYGMRRLRSAYTGNLLRLRRSSDDAESNFGFTGSGDLDTAAIATWLGANSGYIVTWYDQSGGARDATQATAANQPLYVASGQNSRPVVRFDGVAQRMGLTTGGLTNFSIVAALKIDTFAAGSTLLQGAGVIFYQSTGLRAVDNALHPSVVWGGFVAAAWHVMSFVNVANTTKNAWSNGASAGNGGSTGTGWNPTNLGYDATVAGRYLDGDIGELVIASTAWTTAQRQAAEAAANAYWAVY